MAGHGMGSWPKAADVGDRGLGMGPHKNNAEKMLPSLSPAGPECVRCAAAAWPARLLLLFPFLPAGGLGG